jgi:hypothetical protein
MPLRSHSWILAACVLLHAFDALADATKPWNEHPLMGRCFPATSDFVNAAFGADAESDENIKVRAARPLTDGSVWVIDETPMHNPPWFLLQPGKRKELCVTLFLPGAESVWIRRQGTSFLVHSATQGVPGAEVYFRRNAGQPTFQPRRCLKLLASPNRKTLVREPVKCAEAYEWRN